MIDDFYTILAGFGYPVFLQGTINPDDGFPASFFTFWNAETTEGGFYSGLPSFAVWTFVVWFYSNDRLTAETVTEQAFQAFRNAGWVMKSRPRDAVSGIPDYTGRTFSLENLEDYKEVAANA